MMVCFHFSNPFIIAGNPYSWNLSNPIFWRSAKRLTKFLRDVYYPILPQDSRAYSSGRTAADDAWNWLRGQHQQHIERDTYDPRIWDVASSKILNIQIVDSTTFKAVTGLSAPETPISVQTYQEMDLPFFKLWRNELAGNGVAGDWSSIMGVAEVAAANAKLQQSEHNRGSSDSGGEQWGMLKSGVWGRLDQEPPDTTARVENSEETREGGEEEPHLDLPVALLDVDDTVSLFRSVVADDD
jgi:hypothetical protein